MEVGWMAAGRGRGAERAAAEARAALEGESRAGEPTEVAIEAIREFMRGGAGGKRRGCRGVSGRGGWSGRRRGGGGGEGQRREGC
jgi:hypothetical protein